ncbi:hypothetical protein KY092_17910 [Natronomonas gomsonensis]|uniref:hypothetical protein n=1 Tax=Natronomonas gomsonensis TaxID=1046043 RepID=UPI0020CA92B4|nr:hypothetical protein [Natronomonas gomsonensis]MCY4732428.1 hypothetical protein [Natronomonas gomsonensis]
MKEITIKLEDEVIASCERQVQETAFDSTEEYIAFIVSEAASVDEDNIAGERDQKHSEGQLRALGYLD